jgi:hypothetical protein
MGLANTGGDEGPAVIRLPRAPTTEPHDGPDSESSDQEQDEGERTRRDEMTHAGNSGLLYGVSLSQQLELATCVSVVTP